MKIRLAADLETDSIVDGEGLRCVVWFQGCKHNCKGCHNPETHDMRGGFEIDIEELLDKIKSAKNQTGITLSGGDPLYQPEAALEILKFSKENKLNTWVYTGYTFEEVLRKSDSNPVYLDILKNTDVLVDGMFIEHLKSMDTPYRGSSNQRILDVKKSLRYKRPIIKSEYK